MAWRLTRAPAFDKDPVFRGMPLLMIRLAYRFFRNSTTLTKAPKNFVKTRVDISSDEFYAELVRHQEFRESHYSLVGHITVSFGVIETILRTFLAQVINRSDFLPPLLAIEKLSFVNLIDLARSIFRLQEKNIKLQKTFESILQSMDALRIRRNGIIHSFWEYDFDNQRFHYMRILPDKTTRVHFKKTSYTFQDFKALDSAVLSVNKRLLEFVTRWLKRHQPNVTVKPPVHNSRLRPTE